MSKLNRETMASLHGASFDFLVIGAGISGAGVAQEAASRGYRTLLVDKGDFASGTSSKSSKLIHGGLRYLANLQFAVTLESLSERRLQQKLAPHLVWALPFVVPVYKGQFFKNLKLRLGLFLYDLLAGQGEKEHKHRRISKEEVLSSCPGLSPAGLEGGLLYFDCRTDDTRHVLEVILSAVQHGARVCNYARVLSSVKNSDDKIVGAVLQDELTGERATVYASQVVNATGVWTSSTCKSLSSKFEGEIVASKGIHISVPRACLPLNAAAIIPSLCGKRHMFAIPWYESIIVGTTDTLYEGNLDKPPVLRAEVGDLLAALNKSFPGAALSMSDLRGCFAGLRPLVRNASMGETADLSRKHKIALSPQGLISLSGGKLTTYRRMASETVDFALKSRFKFLPVRSRSAKLRLGGFVWGEKVSECMAELVCEGLNLGLPRQTAAYLPRVYGKRCRKVIALVKRRPELAAALLPDYPYIEAQVVFAVQDEAARTLGDVLNRRIRLGILDRRGAQLAAARCADLMASELGWSPVEKAAMISQFLKELEEETLEAEIE